MMMMILDLVNFKVRLLSTVKSKTSLNACKKYVQPIQDCASTRPKPGGELAGNKEKRHRHTLLCH